MTKKELRYYQIEAAEAVDKALARNVKRHLIVMPGGTGKSLTAVNIIKDRGRKLWISHEESLLEQSAIALLSELELMPYNTLLKTIEDADGLIQLMRNYNKAPLFLSAEAKIIASNIGIIKADLCDIDRPIVMASAQTLHNRLHVIPKDHFKVIVTDEADLFGSVTFIAPLNYLEYDLLLGLTATPFRMDNMPMSDIFDEIVYEYPIEQAIKDGYLAEINAILIKTSTDLNDVHTVGGDFNQKELAAKVNTRSRNILIVEKYIEYCSGQQFICFGADVQHVVDLHETFREYGIQTEFVVSDEKLTTKEERKRISNGYKKGEIIGLVNFMIFAVGYDAPNTGCVIAGCPTKSKRKFLQQLFRMTRLKDENFVAKFGQIGTILDVVDGTSKHKLINTYSLDKDLPLEKKVFISKKNRQLLMAVKEKREATIIENKREKDSVVNLLSLPKVKISNSYKMQEPASKLQLDWIAKEGYDIVNVHYTKQMCSEIISNLPASDKQIYALKINGYDVSNGVTVAEAKLAFDEIKKLTENKSAAPPVPVIINKSSEKSNPFLDLK